MSTVASIAAIRDQAREVAYELQPWPGHFEHRAQELEHLLRFYTPSRVQTALELGCGNGFSAIVLRQFADRVVALDLPEASLTTHSLGIEQAARLVQALGVSRCWPVGGRGEALPVASDQCDLVLAQFSLEHVPDKRQAVSEIARVLKRGGHLIAVVPNWMERVYSFPAFYLYLLKRSVIRLWPQNGASSATVTRRTKIEQFETNHREPLTWQRFRAHHPNFPFPDPHGAYATNLEELRAHLPWRWRRLLTEAGLVVRRQFNMMMAPWPLIQLAPRPVAWYRWLAPVELILARVGAMRWLSTYLCLIAQKPL